jgi:hypothetical protein
MSGEIGGLNMSLMLMRFQVAHLERELLEAKLKLSEAKLEATRAKLAETRAELRAIASEKIAQGAHLTRPEVAAYLDVSTRKIQRMEVSGKLARCRGMGTVVRYAASDVQQLASAK